MLIEKRAHIKEFLAKPFDKVIVSISGGKDSSVLMQYALDNFPLEKIVCVHSYIDIDHEETMDVVRAQAKFFNMPLVVVHAVDKHGNDQGYLSVLTSKRIDRVTKEEKENKHADMGNRWCTARLKSGPMDKFARTFSGNVLVLIGERAEESPNRAKLEAIRHDETNSTKKRTVTKFSPLLEMSEREVWAIITKVGMPVHPCYAQGFSRASCAICIFSSDKEIALAAKTQPQIVARYIEAEEKIEHKFRYKPATKTREATFEGIRQILEKQDALKYVAHLLSEKAAS